ncbi:MAG TPA: hypothetical protein VLC46_26225 [Thermoanaerobaculia bacterium]|jgi:hypothetical protein|nr:hypothetical protein [Thermoanaerobaculia bacterium]
MKAWIQRRRQWYLKLGWQRQRLLLVLLSLVPGWAVAVGVAYYLRGLLFGASFSDTATGIFFAFTGELVFFTFVGTIVTAVSLKDPMDQGFGERLKVLYGRSDAPDVVLRYITNLVTKQAGYAKAGKRTIHIESYNETYRAYWVRVKTEYDVHNLLRDVQYNQSMTILVMPAAFDEPAPADLGRLLTAQVGDVNTVTRAMNLPKEGLNTQVTVTVDLGADTCTTVVWEYLSWIRINTPQALSPEWVVGELEMEIISECEARVDIDGDDRGAISMLHMQPVRLPRIQGVSPNEKVCVYTLLSPGSELPGRPSSPTIGS